MTALRNTCFSCDKDSSDEMTCTYLSEAAFSQNLDEMEVLYHILPEARDGPRRRCESSGFPEQIVCRRLFCKKKSGSF